MELRQLRMFVSVADTGRPVLASRTPTLTELPTKLVRPLLVAMTKCREPHRRRPDRSSVFISARSSPAGAASCLLAAGTIKQV